MSIVYEQENDNIPSFKWFVRNFGAGIIPRDRVFKQYNIMNNDYAQCISVNDVRRVGLTTTMLLKILYDYQYNKKSIVILTHHYNHSSFIIDELYFLMNNSNHKFLIANKDNNHQKSRMEICDERVKQHNNKLSHFTNNESYIKVEEYRIANFHNNFKFIDILYFDNEILNINGFFERNKSKKIILCNTD